MSKTRINLKEVRRVLNALEVQKIGRGGVFPGVTDPRAYNPETGVINYSEESATEVLSQVRDEQGLSSLHVLTKTGASLEVYPHGKRICVLSEMSTVAFQQLGSEMGKMNYTVYLPRDKGDSF